jgi:hypothetical protein
MLYSRARTLAAQYRADYCLTVDRGLLRSVEFEQLPTVESGHSPHSRVRTIAPNYAQTIVHRKRKHFPHSKAQTLAPE